MCREGFWEDLIVNHKLRFLLASQPRDTRREEGLCLDCKNQGRDAEGEYCSCQHGQRLKQEEWEKGEGRR